MFNYAWGRDWDSEAEVSWQEAEGHGLWIWSGPVKPPAVEFTGHLLQARSQARPWRVLNLAAGRAGLGSL